jgi:lipopolysaccharide transport system permease protein
MTDKPFLEIAPRKGFIAIDWRELWTFRDLFMFLVWRDIIVRYKQTVLGAAWAILQPLTAMLIFTLFFGKLAKIPSDGVPYPLFSYSGLIIWTFFSHSMAQASGSLISDERLVTKVYFPRLFIPLAPVLSGVVDFGIAFLLLAVMLFVYGVGLNVNLLAIPLVVAIAAIAASGVGIWLSALNIKYRDFRYVIPFLTQLWMFASPVVYPASMVPERWRSFYAINPLVGVIESFRWSVLGTEVNPWPGLLVSATSAMIIFISGVAYFKRTERFFADII